MYLQNRVAYAADEFAYKKLFSLFYKPLCRFAFGMVHNMEDAEEIVSDVFLKIWTMGDKLGLVENLTLYLFKATKNSCLNFLKSADHKKEVITHAITDELPELFIEKPNVELSEVQILIETTINKLPAKCQMVFRLVKENGLTYRQVTDILGISQNTIETQMRIALKRVKQQLDTYLHPKK